MTDEVGLKAPKVPKCLQECNLAMRPADLSSARHPADLSSARHPADLKSAVKKVRPITKGGFLIPQIKNL